MTEDTQPKVKIRVRNVTKRFELLTTRSQKIRNLLSFHRKGKTDFWALRGVSFDVYDGEAVAVIGLNGSGKSTLSNIVSEIYPPTTGTLEIHGDSSIIAIGSGLKNQLTGRDNIRLKLLMNGLKNREINALMPAIIDFSELGAFIEQPVKSYSSGMKSKLGFAIMAHTNPDVMLIDEALSVGDATFANKSFAKIKEFKAQGKTIFFVSHSMSQLRKIADRVIWMHFGEVRMMGPVDEVLPKYEKWLASFNQLTDEQREFYNLQMKEEQRRFSLEAYMASKAEAELQNLPAAVSRLEKIEQEKQKIQVGKQLQKQLTTNKQKLKQTRFGYINWLVAGVLILAVIFTSLTVFSSEMAKYQQEQESQKSVKKDQFKAYKSSSKVSKSSSSEIADTDGDGIPDDQDTTPNGEADTSVIDTDGDGIPDDQDPTPNGEVATSVVDTDGDGIPDDQDPTPNGEVATSVVDTDGDGIPDDQDSTPNGEAASSQETVSNNEVESTQSPTSDSVANTGQDSTQSTDAVVGTN